MLQSATISPPLAPQKSRLDIARLYPKITSILFMVALILPLIGTWLHWDPQSATGENRRMAPVPTWPRTLQDAREFPDQFIAFFRDHFGFRNALIHASAFLSPRDFDLSDRASAFIGKDGWLFYRSPGDPDLLAFRGLAPLTEKQLDVWQSTFEDRNHWLASHGIPYLVLVCPDKQSIYPEFLPDGLNRPGNRTHLDQLIDRLQSTGSTVRLIDIRADLLRAKPTQRVFKKTDTHWNDLGAFIGYRDLMNAIAQALPGRNIAPHALQYFDLQQSLATSGDLARILSLSSSYTEEDLQLIPHFPHRDFHPSEIEDHRLTVSDDPHLPRLLMFQDSFANALKPLLAPHFSQAEYFKRSFDPQLVLQTHPDIVVSELSERLLNDVPHTFGMNAP